ncbi:MAG: alpha/beta fold hydrolase [Desulfobacteraceae bacterium]|nr:alpha/beta fold hydrolase [Desulfobacteraceae bacterium]
MIQPRSSSDQRICIEALPLRVHLKTKFRHAHADRSDGESIWVRAERNGIYGFGEGCPRDYVAGDDLATSVAMIREQFVSGDQSFSCFEDMTAFARTHEEFIKRYPSAWCALEMALLDLFARETGQSIEAFLGIEPLARQSRYSAVLGDDRTWRYTYLTDQYMIRNMTDFKVKVKGVLAKDQKKLDIIARLAADHGLENLRIRLDANNLWAGRTEEAIEYIRLLKGDFFGIEEPVGARDIEGMRRVNAETGLAIILDESLLTLEDLDRLEGAAGTYIANVKISKVGGLLRALELIKALKDRDMRIIIGCHVGETSLLTRVAMIAAGAAGQHLIAHEGAFGDYLMEWEPVKPMLRFGHKGRLDLDTFYYYKTVMGLNVVAPEVWNQGFGVEGRINFEINDSAPMIESLEMPDGYKVHYRTWGAPTGEDALVILHGGMSHSGWQAPLAGAIRNLNPQMTVIALDRRGCGLNTPKGDLGTVKAVIADVVHHLLYLKRSFKRVHLAGWCQGCQFASVAAVRLGEAIDSLILLTPGFFWNERFRSVISIAEQVVLKMIDTFDLTPARDHACIPIPMEGTDFTLSDRWLDFISNDPLKTTMITLKSASIMDEVQELSWMAMLEVDRPMLMVIANQDRIVDNAKVLQFIGHRFTGGNGNRLVHVDSSHAIQFGQANKAAEEIVGFIGTLGSK